MSAHREELPIVDLSDDAPEGAVVLRADSETISLPYSPINLALAQKALEGAGIPAVTLYRGVEAIGRAAVPDKLVLPPLSWQDLKATGLETDISEKDAEYKASRAFTSFRWAAVPESSKIVVASGLIINGLLNALVTKVALGPPDDTPSQFREYRIVPEVLEALLKDGRAQAISQFGKDAQTLCERALERHHRLHDKPEADATN